MGSITNKTTVTRVTKIELDRDDILALVRAQYAYMTDFKIEVAFKCGYEGDVLESAIITATQVTEE